MNDVFEYVCDGLDIFGDFAFGVIALVVLVIFSPFLLIMGAVGWISKNILKNG